MLMNLTSCKFGSKCIIALLNATKYNPVSQFALYKCTSNKYVRIFPVFFSGMLSCLNTVLSNYCAWDPSSLQNIPFCTGGWKLWKVKIGWCRLHFEGLKNQSNERSSCVNYYFVAIWTDNAVLRTNSNHLWHVLKRISLKACYRKTVSRCQNQNTLVHDFDTAFSIGILRHVNVLLHWRSI